MDLAPPGPCGRVARLDKCLWLLRMALHRWCPRAQALPGGRLLREPCSHPTAARACHEAVHARDRQRAGQEPRPGDQNSSPRRTDESRQRSGASGPHSRGRRPSPSGVRVRRTASAGHLAEAVGAPFLGFLLASSPEDRHQLRLRRRRRRWLPEGQPRRPRSAPADRACATPTPAPASSSPSTASRQSPPTAPTTPPTAARTGAAHDGPTRRAGKCAWRGPRGLGRVLFVLRGGALTGPIVGPADLVVVMAHGEPPLSMS